MPREIRSPGRKPSRPAFHVIRPAPEPAPASEMNIVAQAVVVLGGRVTTLRGVRLLDGSPCDLDRLMTAANRALAARGMAQLGRNPAWLA